MRKIWFAFFTSEQPLYSRQIRQVSSMSSLTRQKLSIGQKDKRVEAPREGKEGCLGLLRGQSACIMQPRRDSRVKRPVYFRDPLPHFSVSPLPASQPGIYSIVSTGDQCHEFFMEWSANQLPISSHSQPPKILWCFRPNNILNWKKWIETKNRLI